VVGGFKGVYPPLRLALGSSRLWAGKVFFQNRPAGKFTAPTPCTLRDLNQENVAAVVEAFDSSYEVFFLIYPLSGRPEALSVAL
jgi:hypothetical protein